MPGIRFRRSFPYPLPPDSRESLDKSIATNLSLLFTYRVAVAPAAKLHEAALLVEREVPHVDLAVGLEDGRRVPDHAPPAVYHRLRQRGDDVLTVSTGTQMRGELNKLDCREGSTVGREKGPE